MSDREFELVWTKCLESLDNYCQTLRSKRKRRILDFGDDSYLYTYLFLISDWCLVYVVLQVQWTHSHHSHTSYTVLIAFRSSVHVHIPSWSWPKFHVIMLTRLDGISEVHSWIVWCPNPPAHAKRVWCSERHFLSVVSNLRAPIRLDLTTFAWCKWLCFELNRR